MTVIFGAIGILVVVALCGVVWRAVVAPSNGERSKRASIMDAEPQGMSLFSSDHVRMLSESQLRAMESDEDEAA